MAKAFGARLFEFKEIDLIRNPLRKYSRGILHTLQVISRVKPGVVFGQNPSLVLSLLLVCLRKIFNFKVIIDAHNAGIFPAEGRSGVLMVLSRFVQRHADLVIITNYGMKQHVESNGGKAFILPDKIPDISPAIETRKLKGRMNILFICSYAADEPYEAVFKAAARLPEDVFVYVTGNYQKKNIRPSALPANVILTGFVPMEEFEILLHSVDATIDLTTREDCLVCGAYESVAVEKPMVLSDTNALRDYFYKGAVYTLHSAEAIWKAIFELIDSKDRLTMQVKELKVERTHDWEQQRQILEDHICRMIH